MATSRFVDNVFINCPFDRDYEPLFEAVVFAVAACGFSPRSSLEEADGGEIRLHKIARLIAESRFGIHDLSRVELDQGGYPRFNMPFELGIDWTYRHVGTLRQRQKCLLLMEREQHSLKRYLSDIGGQDPVHHHNSPNSVLRVVRRFLASSSRRSDIPGELALDRQFKAFSSMLPRLCSRSGLDRNNLAFVDYIHLIRNWLDCRNTLTS